jgi:nucleotide-binding universal stress UspA family protein
MKTLLAAIDFSKTTDVVLKQSSLLAKALHEKLWIIHVATDESTAIAYEGSLYSDYSPDFVSIPSDVQLARDISAEHLKCEHAELLVAAGCLRDEGIDAQAILLKGNAADGIIEKALDLKADIIILGSHGHGLLHKALLGSVSESVMRRAHCNVMVVPTPER